MLVKRSSSLGFIFITILIDFLGIGLLIPILPEFIAHLTHESLNGASQHYGALLSIYGGMQFLFAPMLGMLSDRFGRRPVLLLSMLFSGINYVIMALAPTLLWLYVGRTLSGICGGSFTAANAYIADVSPPEKRAQDFGIIGAAFGIGFIIGPAVGGLLAQWGIRLPFWAAAVLCLVNFLYGWIILPESLKPENRRFFRLREANPWGAVSILKKYPLVWGLTGTFIAAYMAGQFLDSTWVLFMMTRFGWTTRSTGISLAAYGAMALVYQLWIVKWLVPLWGERCTMLFCLAMGVVGCTTFAFSTQGWMIYAILILGGAGFFLTVQVTQGLLSQQVSEDQQGALQGALSSLASLTGVVGPVLSTSLFAVFTLPGASIYFPGIAFLTAAIFNLVALGLALRALVKMRIRRIRVESTFNGSCL
jgi:DHA1 family tetracycline resistance protein-like MFS transporter